MKSWVVMAVIFLLHAPVAAQDSPPRIPPGEDVTAALERGAPAPYRGVLLDVDTSIRHIHAMEWLQYRLTLERDTHAAAMIAIEGSYERQLTASSASYEREIEGLRADLLEEAALLQQASQPDPFWETPGFGFVMGVLLSAVLVGLTLGLTSL